MKNKLFVLKIGESMLQIIRKTLLIFIATVVIAGIALWAIPYLRLASYTVSLLCRPAPAVLPVPVEGVPASQLVDSWGAPRSGGRHHEGIDIYGKRGTRIHSTTEGIVTAVGDNHLGGQCVWVMGPGGYIHYYAHLDAYGNVWSGERIEAGHFIGTVGDSGNAKGTPPHLHYGIYKLSGGAIDPYPLLRRPVTRNDSIC